MKLQVNVDALKSYLESNLKVEDLKISFDNLKKGWDWNPFDDDDDKYKTAWDELRHNVELLHDFCSRVILVVEKGSKVLKITEGGAKLEAAVKFLDEKIKLPFYLEWADDKIFRMVLALLVTNLNKALGKNWVDKYNLG